ncbi:MAG: site-specific DNA-methyltransferase [Lachnospiraceae bacterium]|nr:site-specific DNA-methyltransferase [Lachnospiraceae bacterium]
MQKTGKLELTWVGKYDEPSVEPRILLEDKSKSYGDQSSENMLIHGDNLVALKALEANYSGRVKCIYIDPPFNTGQAFESYDDGIEHSIWLNLMHSRFKIMRNLLADDGTLFVHIDDNEIGYLIVLLDEIFGRNNRISIVSFKQASATGHKAINPGIVSITNFILIYSKSKSLWKPNRVYTDRGERDKRYSNYITNINEPYENWKITTLTEAFARSFDITLKEARALIKNNPEEIDKFVIEHCESVIQLVNPDYKNVGASTREYIDISRANPNQIFRQVREGYSDIILLGGKRIIFYKEKLKKIDGKYVAGEPLTSLWDDILSNNIHNEGGVDFPKSKKPEALIKRCLELTTQENDLVLDSFLGSGTTAAVAHKMRRRYIGIEMGDHAYTHCKIRLDGVIDGDQGGISKAVDWQGGGGYHFYELAPSLLVKNNKLPIYQINPSYTLEMLCEAICKIEGFRYKPQDVFHGYSSEKRFIHITTEFINAGYIKALSAHLAEGQSLLIYGMKIQSDMVLPDNIEVKKIPKDLLEKCDFESEVQ